MHTEWHAWEPGPLVQLNDALQAGELTQTTPDLIQLIRQSQALEERSAGRFNPAIGNLIDLWGFHTSEYPIKGPPPSRAAISKLLNSSPSSLDIEFHGTQLKSNNPLVQLDFGGIAKGYAVDLAIEIIRNSGQRAAVVNAGGDMRAIGNNRGKPWRVGVQDSQGGIAGGIEISGDLAVFTSGNYARFREDADERYAHILDPRTGWPVDSIASATVIADTGTLADAVATAMMVAGDENWSEVAEGMGVLAAMIIDESGAIYATREMMRFFEPARGREVTIVNAE